MRYPATPKLISYPGNLREKLFEMMWGEKKRDVISLYNTNYELVEDNNDTIAMIGQIDYTAIGISSVSNKILTAHFAGPINHN